MDIATDGKHLILPGGQTVPCAMGRGGLIHAPEKREGDGATPIGRWRLTEVFYRSDRVDPPPRTGLPIRALRQDDGWCDDPADPAYNSLVSLPHPTSHEEMWRSDGLYDLVVVTDHNMDPAVPGLGSAIFLHCRNPEGRPTAGCIALDRDILFNLLSDLKGPAYLDIRPTLPA